MFVIVERSYGVVEKFSRLGWHAVSINFMYWFSRINMEFDVKIARNYMLTGMHSYSCN